MLNQIFDYLENELASMAQNFKGFGYKERMQIERGLFLVLKLISKERFQYNLQGFSKAHKDSLLTVINNVRDNESFAPIVEHTYQLKVYLQTLSSENAYVRGDALSRLGLNRQTVFYFITNEIQRLQHRINVISNKS